MIFSAFLKLFILQQLAVGTIAPNFVGIDQNNKTVSLDQFKGKRVVLYFYPKDNTPGCTAQACNLRDNTKLLQDKGYIVIGVSADDVKSHQKFSKKYQLPFPILADNTHTISKQYKVHNALFGISNRTTFLIDEKGNIAHVILSPKTNTHAEEIISLWQ